MRISITSRERKKRAFWKPREETTMAEEGAVIACHTEEHWRQQLQLANESNKLVIYPSSPLLCFRSCYPSLFLMRIRCFLLKVSILVFWNSLFLDVIFRSVQVIYGAFSPLFFVLMLLLLLFWFLGFWVRSLLGLWWDVMLMVNRIQKSCARCWNYGQPPSFICLFIIFDVHDEDW